MSLIPVYNVGHLLVIVYDAVYHVFYCKYSVSQQHSKGSERLGQGGFLLVGLAQVGRWKGKLPGAWLKGSGYLFLKHLKVSSK